MITRPTLLVNKTQAVKNISAIIQKCTRHKMSFRPHFKTHQSATVGQWYRELGVKKITVSSVVMAEYFVSHGWKDLMIAFPYNPLEAGQINELAKKVKIGVLIESTEALNHLQKNVPHPVDYHLAIDCGYHRTGISFEKPERVIELMNFSTHHHFTGWLTHAGHTYNARSKTEIEAVHLQSLANLQELKRVTNCNPYISYGDTPSASISENWEGIDELRCGNMVYYDLTQVAIGSCSYPQVAAVVACPIVSIHPERSQLVVYGGGVHFSKDRLEQGGETTFGQAVRLKENGWELIKGVRLVGLSQEHGKVSAPSSFIENCTIGELIGFLPVHSCMAADLLVLQQTLTGEPIEKLMLK